MTRIYGSLKSAYGTITISTYNDAKGYFVGITEEHFTNYRNAVKYAKAELKQELEQIILNK